MNILIVNTTDILGGAARAAYRLHKGLLDKGINSEMLVQFKKSNDPTVNALYSDSKISKIYSRLRPYANALLQETQITTNPILHSANYLPSGIHRRINNSDVDIIHLNWVNEEMVSIKEISKITKPIIWTLHDMWAICGSEHHDHLQSPGRYKEGYVKKNRPENHRGLDIDRWTWNRKLKYWQDKKLSIVTPSRWLENCVRKSVLFKEKNVQVIPNGLNLDRYKPIPQKLARKILNLNSSDKIKYVLFGAMSAISNVNKGYKELKKALEILASSSFANNYHLIIFGSEGNNSINFELPTTYLGQLKDDETLALAYSAADVMVVPSRQENLPNTAIEAIACGTPIVAFNIGGLPDIVDHKKNGYLAKPYEAEDFANGIEWVLENTDRITTLSINARSKAVDTFDIKKVSKQYVKLYENILSWQA